MKLRLSGERAGAAALGLLALGLVVAWSPFAPRRTASREARATTAIVRRAEWVTPAEVLSLLHDPRVAVEVFDLREEAAYNEFHIADARRLWPARLDPVRALPPTTVKILVGGDEPSATVAYRELALAGVGGVYLLEGGAGGWLRAFGAASCRGSPLCRPGLALGDRHPASRPDPRLAGKYTPKVKLAAAKKLAGGCGG